MTEVSEHLKFATNTILLVNQKHSNDTPSGMQQSYNTATVQQPHGEIATNLQQSYSKGAVKSRQSRGKVPGKS
jgi:hypothetical protein